MKFHSGNELTAEDVKFTYERQLNPADLARDAAVIKMLKTPIQVVDRYTLILETREPNAALVDTLAQSLATLIPDSARDQEVGEGLRAAPLGHRPVQVRRVGARPAREARPECRLLERPALRRLPRVQGGPRGGHPGAGPRERRGGRPLRDAAERDRDAEEEPEAQGEPGPDLPGRQRALERHEGADRTTCGSGARSPRRSTSRASSRRSSRPTSARWPPGSSTRACSAPATSASPSTTSPRRSRAWPSWATSPARTGSSRRTASRSR